MMILILQCNKSEIGLCPNSQNILHLLLDKFYIKTVFVTTNLCFDKIKYHIWFGQMNIAVTFFSFYYIIFPGEVATLLNKISHLFIC